MTWNETHERIRIIREVEAAAALDMSGALPWREEWSAYFAGPAGLIAALRSRWHHMCEAQLDPHAGVDQFHDTYGRLRRTQAAVLAILQCAEAADHAGTSATDLLTLTGPRPPHSPTRSRRFHLRGPVLPV